MVVELLWCLFRNGYLESRSGLVYGPFNPVYGIGAVIMTLTLYRYRNRSSSISFFGGALVGSVIEYLLSWGQETLFGSTSWDYSHMPFNLNGRICAEGLLAFGLGGLATVYLLAPALDNLLARAHRRIMAVVAIVLLVAYVGDNIYSSIVPNTGAGITDYKGSSSSAES